MTLMMSTDFEWEGADAGLYQVETLDLSGYDELINKE